MAALDNWREWDPDNKAELLRRLRHDWKLWARDDQLPPTNDEWLVWMLMAGRGSGKTRAGAEYAREKAESHPKWRVGVIAPTHGDCRDICFEGESGLMEIIPPGNIEHYNRSNLELILRNGSRFKGYSAEKPDRLRGPQHHLLWCEEIASWQFPETYDQAQFGLRLGERPRTIITTTPRPTQFIKDFVERSEEEPNYVVISRASTFDNAENLPQSQLDELRRRYADTYLGQQELYGALIDDIEGALWKRAVLDETRITLAQQPQMSRVVIGVDPAVTSNEKSDETGIIVLGKGVDGQGYVLGDYSLRGTPDQWARKVVEAYHAHRCDRVVAEVNNGGEMVKYTLRTIESSLPVKTVTATRGKAVRAEPISAMYEQRKVHHVGIFGALEDQMCSWIPGETVGRRVKSPDRVDALVWAGHELLLKSGVPSMAVARPR